MKKIVIIGAYFGRIRSDFQLWLNSCGYNKDIDFIVIADANLSEFKIPENVHIKAMTLEKFKEIFQKKLGVECFMGRSYKLCDYRPMYGYVFSDFTHGYDFWGYCDFDMIFGNLRSFLVDGILSSFDKIYYLGHLSIYRNCDTMNRLFMTRIGSFDYKKVCSSSKNNIFDESGGMIEILKSKRIKTYRNIDYADIDKYSWDLENKIDGSGFGIPNDKQKNFKNQIFTCENGRIYKYFLVNNRVERFEYSYIHFSGRRYNPSNSSNFIICEDRLVPFSGRIEKKHVLKYNKKRFFLVRVIRKKISILRAKFKNIGVYEKYI